MLGAAKGALIRAAASTPTFGAPENLVSWQRHGTHFGFEPNILIVLVDSLGNSPVHQLPAAIRQFKENELVSEFGGRMEGEAAIPNRRIC